MSEQSQLAYPPIARVAHVSGNVILLVRFDNNGTPVNIRVISGPPMLQSAAVSFVKTWRANEYTGPRECPIGLSFNMVDGEPVCSSDQAESPKVFRSDPQHVSISIHSIWLCGPAATIAKTHKRWF